VVMPRCLVRSVELTRITSNAIAIGVGGVRTVDVELRLTVEWLRGGITVHGPSPGIGLKD